MDRFDLSAHVDPHVVLRRADLAEALIIGVESDMLFAIAEQRSLAEAFQASGTATQFAPLPCIEGHDAFLVDTERFGRVIGGFLAG
jgi:homoserine O-acetyltransferase